MESITSQSTPTTSLFAQLTEGATLDHLAVESEHNAAATPFRLGPVFFSGRSPFRIRVIILTCFAIPEESIEPKGAYVTYVGYKKEADKEFDFDEMIPSNSQEDALKTHSKACGFFGNSPLFVKSAI
ncbi:MAG: hypothetical protein IPO83_15920 [Chitinophagaceae bacterium]|nr:hypothetical protein [Chitinophagaceae bacterium]